MTEGGSTVYKSLQPNTVLNLYHVSDYDGNGTPAFVIIGNPVVLSSTDYIIYSDGYNEKQYIRNQNVLSDWEKVIISTDVNNPTEIPYDGFITVHNMVGTPEFSFYVNGVGITDEGASFNAPRGKTLPLKKGDLVYETGATQASTAYFLACYYKLRDYSDR